MLPSQRDTLITTPRLALAPAARSDFEDWSTLRLESRDHLEKWEPRWSSDAGSRSDWNRRLKAWSLGWKQGRMHVFLFRAIETGEMIGSVSLTNVRGWPADSANLGYWVGAAFQGKGYMQEAVKAICQWGFEVRGLARIEAGTLPENTRSRHVLTRVGFQEEGRAVGYLEIGGQRRDHMIYGLVTSGLTR